MNLKSLLFCLAACGTLLATTGCKKEPDRDKFLGSYNVNENCTSGTYSYSINITTSANSPDDIIINNFGDYQVNIVAKVSGNNISFNETKDAISFAGSGSLSGTTLTIIYSASALGVSDNCTKTCIKQ